MSDKRRDSAEAADRVFDREGFADVGIDRVVGEAKVALGTLYRHYRTRSDVITAALDHRHTAFLSEMEDDVSSEEGADNVLRLFDTLKVWADRRGGNGCFFLRAASDYPNDAEVRKAALDHKQRYLATVERRLSQAGWHADDVKRLAPTIFVLLEGAAAAAFTLGDEAAIACARRAAATILAQPNPGP